jgi:4-amino-4-deoxy-L-arabinose transferase-like glycosyltransferase
MNFTSSTRNLTALIFAGALALHLMGTWILPLVDRDEPRFAEASREMLQRGDYVVPFFNNAYRFDKPPLIYWCQVASMKLFGENEFAARFPSAVAAALIAVLIFGFGTRVAGSAVGLKAAIVFTTSLQVLVHAKLAVADMAMVCFVTAGFWSGWELSRPPEQNNQKQNRLWWWIFYLSLAIGFLAKGPVAWLPLLAPIQAAWKRDGSWRQFKPVTGILIMFAVIAIWAIPALLQTNGDFLRIGIGKHIIQRSVAPMEGHGLHGALGYLVMLPLYFLTVFASFFPWSFFLPRLISSKFRADARGEIDNYLLLGIAATFILFTLVSTKLPHYTLPCFPLLSLWLALNWENLVPSKKNFQRMAIGVAVLAIIVSLVGFSLVRPCFPAAEMFSKTKSLMKPEMEFASTGYQEPGLVWYFRGEVRGFYQPMNPAALPDFMATPGARFCILPTAKVPDVFPTIPPSWIQTNSSGMDFVHFKRVDLTMLVKPE